MIIKAIRSRQRVNDMTTRTHEHGGMAHFHQMRSACGLASSLMIVQPRDNDVARRVLEMAAARLEASCHAMKMALNAEVQRFQLAAAYILLKMSISDSVGGVLTRHDELIYGDIQAVILHEMRTRLCAKYKKSTTMASILDDYVATGSVPCKLVEAYATVMKSNVELKLLLAAFGLQPVLFPGSTDGTGALVITHHGDQGDAWRFMLSNFDECGILAWQGFHWSAVKAIIETDGEVDAIYCLDPGTPAARGLPLDPRDSRTSLYFFKKNAVLIEQVLPLVVKSLGTTIEEKKEQET